MITRTVVRDAAIAAIDAQGKPTGLVVRPWLTELPEESELPLVEIAYLEEEIVGGDSSGPIRRLQWRTMLVVQGASGDPQGMLDELSAWIVERVVNHLNPQPAPGVTILETREGRTEFNAGEREQVLGAAAINWETDYATVDAAV